MDKKWIQEFYNETDAEKRLEYLKQNNPDSGKDSGLRSSGSSEDGENSSAAFRKRLWTARYGKRKPKNDAFVGGLMELKYISEGGAVDIGGQKKKQAVEIVSKLCLFDADNRSADEQEMLLYELKNAFLKFIEVSRGGRGFTSIAFGMGQLSDEGVAKKIADQISSIAFTAPHMLHMDKEFAILQSAALAAFRQEYPNREHFLRK